MTHYLGIDAGGTRCCARLVDDDGQVIGTGEAGPASTRLGIAAVEAALRGASDAAIAEAGLDAPAIAAIRCGMGIAGITRTGMKAQIAALDFPFAGIALTSDSIIANLGAHAGGDGAVLILGTGSIALIRRGEDSSSIGGYGFPISDEGSGAALGLSAIRHALRALDGRTRPSSLSQAVTLQFDHAIPRIIAWMDAATPRRLCRARAAGLRPCRNG